MAGISTSGQLTEIHPARFIRRRTIVSLPDQLIEVVRVGRVDDRRRDSIVESGAPSREVALPVIGAGTDSERANRRRRAKTSAAMRSSPGSLSDNAVSATISPARLGGKTLPDGRATTAGAVCVPAFRRRPYRRSLVRGVSG